MHCNYASTAAFLISLFFGGLSAEAAGASMSSKLINYPIVAQHTPEVRYLVENYPPEIAAAMLARYDVLITNRSYFAAPYASVWDQALSLNPNLAIVLQIPIWTNPSCPSLDLKLAEFDDYLTALGARKDLIDLVDIDGAGQFALRCGQAELVDAVRRFREKLTEHSITQLLTINGTVYRENVASCNYKAASDSSGSAKSKELPALINGTMEEGWISLGMNGFYYNGKGPGLVNKGLDHANSRVKEGCAWVKKGVQPSYVIATHDNTETPWWNLHKEPSSTSWRNMRIGFTAAHMYDNILFVYSPALTGSESRSVNPEKLFWGDYYAVDMTTGSVPSYGDNKISSSDDSLDNQLSSGGYLGAPSKKAKVTPLAGGNFMEREFACGYIYANLSPVGRKVTPAVGTRKILGRQDRRYDDGTSRKSYNVPAGDGLVLLKKSCVGP